MGRALDLTGQRFGKLVAVRPTDERYNRHVVWECKCDCGNICYASTNSLRAGKTKSCGCFYAGIVAGQRFGKLVAVRKTDKRQGRNVLWECRCDCGETCYVPSYSLRNGRTRSCGCSRISDIAGRRFGKLVAVKATRQRRFGCVVWECICDCGNVCFVSNDKLNKGETKSCGCDNISIKSKRLHEVWRGMVQRCENPRNSNYRNYGAKGISVCDEWKHYPNFEKWSFENGYNPDAPHGECSIDRIDVYGDYCPANCRFVNSKVQNRNRTSNKGVIAPDGKKYATVSELAENLCMKYGALYMRIKRGEAIDGVVYRFADQD